MTGITSRGTPRKEVDRPVRLAINQQARATHLRHIDIDHEDYRELKNGAAELRRVGARWIRHAAEIGQSDLTLSNLMAREAAVALDIATRLEELLKHE
jgi:hypothetical protein